MYSLAADRNQNQSGMSTITISGSSSDDVDRAIDEIMNLTKDRLPRRDFNEPKAADSPASGKPDDFVAIDWQAAAQESVINSIAQRVFLLTQNS